MARLNKPVRTVLVCLVALGHPALAATLTAGEGQTYPSPSAAARAAQDGDVIQIAPGEYFDCIVTDRSITIQGPATLTDKTCEGKALLVLRGASSVVRDLTLARARVPDENGAGIRLEGRDTTIERVRFDNNEVAILGGTGRVTMIGCDITAGQAGMTAILVGDAERLIIQDTRISVLHGLALSSSAGLTTVTGGTITTADRGAELAGPTILDGVAITLRGSARVFARATGGGITIRRTQLINETGAPAMLLLDWGPGRPVLEGNKLNPRDQEVSTDGAIRHRIGAIAREAKAGLRNLARSAKHAVLGP